MADAKISALTAGTPAAADTFPLQRGGTANFASSISVLENVLAGTLGGMIAGTGITGQKFVWNAGTPKWIDDDFSMTYIVSNPVGAVTYPGVECGFAGQIESVRLYSGTIMGNGTIDIYKQTYANLGAAPGTADSIVGTATKPAIAGTNRYENTSLTGWTATTFSKGDWIIPYVTGSGTILNLSIAISGRKTAVS